MFCPVYGCNNNSKNNPEKKIQFFAFPKEGSKDEQSRRRIWIDFCRRKNFVPSKYTGLCSKHFRNDSYILSHALAGVFVLVKLCRKTETATET